MKVLEELGLAHWLEQNTAVGLGTALNSPPYAEADKILATTFKLGYKTQKGETPKSPVSLVP